jgi:hypothetical protein
MLFAFAVLAVCIGVFVAVLAAIECGWRIGRAAVARGAHGLAKGVGATDAAIFALLGLMLAFSFSGAASRFEARRHLITSEANAIGTAWLRLDVLPQESQPVLRDLFRRYLDERLVAYEKTEDNDTFWRHIEAANALQGEIWSAARSASLQPGVPPMAMSLILPALNNMFDIATDRLSATRNHPPTVLFVLMIALSLIASMFAGYNAAANVERTWLHSVGYAAVLSIVLYMILDLEFPRQGLIQVDSADIVLRELRASMN